MVDKTNTPPTVSRPTRAELRRAAEKAATSSGGGDALHMGSSVGPVDTRSVSRLEQRRQADARARELRSSKALWRAWWLYPLAAAIGFAVFLGIRSAGNTPVPEPSVITTITAQP